MTRSSSVDAASSSNTNIDPDVSPRPGRGGAWLGWGLLAAFVAVLLLALIAAWRSSSNGAVNRGPADEAAPGAHPSRDIDRSRSP